MNVLGTILILELLLGLGLDMFVTNSLMRAFSLYNMEIIDPNTQVATFVQLKPSQEAYSLASLHLAQYHQSYIFS